MQSGPWYQNIEEARSVAEVDGRPVMLVFEAGG